MVNGKWLPDFIERLKASAWRQLYLPLLPFTHARSESINADSLKLQLLTARHCQPFCWLSSLHFQWVEFTLVTQTVSRFVATSLMVLSGLRPESIVAFAASVWDRFSASFSWLDVMKCYWNIQNDLPNGDALLCDPLTCPEISLCITMSLPAISLFLSHTSGSQLSSFTIQFCLI